MAHRSVSRGAGSDRRLQVASRQQMAYRQKTEDEIEAAMDELIERAHRRLLERATAGRLTWEGDRIIRRSRWTAGSLTAPRSARPAVIPAGPAAPAMT